jgi:hypothetical protein
MKKSYISLSRKKYIRYLTNNLLEYFNQGLLLLKYYSILIGRDKVDKVKTTAEIHDLTKVFDKSFLIGSALGIAA